MPGSGFGSTRLFYQNMIMKQLYGGRLHQLGGHLDDIGISNRSLKGRYPRPVAIVIKETSWFTSLQIFGCVRSRQCHIDGYAVADILNMISKQATHQNNTVSGKIVNVLLG